MNCRVFSPLSLIFILLFCCSTSLFAQKELSFSAKGGFNNGKLKLQDGSVTLKEGDGMGGSDSLVVSSGKNGFGFHIGGSMKYKNNNLYFQPEIILTHSSSELIVKELGTESYSSMQSVTKIDIPFTGGYQKGFLRLYLGGTASYMIDGNTRLDKDSAIENAKEQLNRVVVSLHGGAGVDILKRISFDLVYEASLTNLVNGIVVDGQTFTNFSQKQNLFSTKFGYYLFRK